MQFRPIPSFAAFLVLSAVQAQHMDLDPAFGNDGIVFQQEDWPMRSAAPFQLAALPDGRLVGAYRAGTDTTMLACFLANGTADESFGPGGSILITNTETHRYKHCALAITPSGHVLVAGALTPLDYGPERVFQILRLRSDGTLDESFGDNGLVHYSAADNSGMSAFALAPDGKMFVAGYLGLGITLVRLDQQGQVDMTFANGAGNYSSSTGETTRARTMNITASGDIYIAGHVASGLNVTKLMLLKVLANGMLDLSYAQQGFFIHDHTANPLRGEALHKIHVGADGGLLAFGRIALEGVRERLCVVKLMADGTLDEQYATGGVLLLGTEPDEKLIVDELVLDPRGFIVACATMIDQPFFVHAAFVLFDMAGNPLPDPDGNVVQIYTPPDVPQLGRAYSADGSGGVMLAIEYYNRPVGVSSLTRFVHSPSLGAEDPGRSATAVLLWPNPTSGAITIQHEAPFGTNATIALMDATGRLIPLPIASLDTSNGHLQVQLTSDLANGIYAVLIDKDGERTVSQFVLQR